MTRYKRADDYLLEEVDGEILLYHPVAETMVYCNATAAYVWGLCDGARTVDEIVALFAACYPDDASDIAHQVRATIAELSQRCVLIPMNEAGLAAADARPGLPRSYSELRRPASGG